MCIIFSECTITSEEGVVSFALLASLIVFALLNPDSLVLWSENNSYLLDCYISCIFFASPVWVDDPSRSVCVSVFLPFLLKTPWKMERA